MSAAGFPTASGSFNDRDVSAGLMAIQGQAGRLMSLASLTLSVAGACNVSVQDEYGETMFPTIFFGAAGTQSFNFSPRSFNASTGGSGVKVISNNATHVSAAVECYLLPSEQQVAFMPAITSAPSLLTEGDDFDIEGDGFYSLLGGVEVRLGADPDSMVTVPGVVEDPNTISFTAPAPVTPGQPFLLQLQFENSTLVVAPVGQESEYVDDEAEAVSLTLAPSLSTSYTPPPPPGPTITKTTDDANDLPDDQLHASGTGKIIGVDFTAGGRTVVTVQINGAFVGYNGAGITNTQIPIFNPAGTGGPFTLVVNFSDGPVSGPAVTIV